MLNTKNKNKTSNKLSVMGKRIIATTTAFLLLASTAVGVIPQIEQSENHITASAATLPSINFSITSIFSHTAKVRIPVVKNATKLQLLIKEGSTWYDLGYVHSNTDIYLHSAFKRNLNPLTTYQVCVKGLNSSNKEIAKSYKTFKTTKSTLYKLKSSVACYDSTTLKKKIGTLKTGGYYSGQSVNSDVVRIDCMDYLAYSNSPTHKFVYIKRSDCYPRESVKVMSPSSSVDQRYSAKDRNDGTNACGPAALSAIVNYSTAYKTTAKTLRTNFYATEKEATLSNKVASATKNEVTLSWSNQNISSRISDALNNGKYALLLIPYYNRQIITNSQYLHYVVVCGATADSYIVADSLYNGDKESSYKYGTNKYFSQGLRIVSKSLIHSATKNVGIPNLNHKHSYGTYSTITSPTCTEKGGKRASCSCGSIHWASTAAKGHSFSSWTTSKKATCTSTGTEIRKCKNCRKTESRSTKALGHNYSSTWTTDKKATCTTSGSKSHHCTRCSSKKDVTTVKALGHSYGNWITTTEPGCETEGVQTKTCSRCKDKQTKALPALDHNYGEWETTLEPTCTTEGTKQHTCTRCAKIETETMPALGHQYSTEWTIDKQPTCTEYGSKSHHCIRCDEKTDETMISKLNHNFTKTSIVKPTKTSKGYSIYTCSQCGIKINKDFVPKLQSISIAKIKASKIKTYTYNGKQIKPVITIKYNSQTLKKNVDYIIKYGTNKIGTGTITIIGKNTYFGKITKKFTILPRSTTINLVSGNKKFFVKTAKRNEATKYQIQYSSNNRFRGVKTIKTVSTKKAIKAISKKKYYVRARVVKFINGKCYYSKWSKTKAVKIK